MLLTTLIAAAAPFAVAAEAPQVCALGAPRLAAAQAVNFRGVDGALLGVDTLVDPATLSTQAAAVTVDFDGACNYPHRLLLQSENNGLWRDGRSTEGFADAVPYTATLSWGEASGRLDADASARTRQDLSVSVDEPTSGALSLELDIEPGASNLHRGSPLLAGTYRDTLRITVQPR